METRNQDLCVSVTSQVVPSEILLCDDPIMSQFTEVIIVIRADSSCINGGRGKDEFS